MPDKIITAFKIRFSNEPGKSCKAACAGMDITAMVEYEIAQSADNKNIKVHKSQKALLDAEPFDS